MRPPRGLRARTPAGDDPLAALIAELTRLDREISATRAAAKWRVAPLVSRRHDLRDRAIALAMEQTQPAE